MNNKPVAALYGRVSLEDQASNFSLPSQLRAMEAHAKAKGFDAPKEFQFIEDGLGGELDRPGLTRLREAVRAGLVRAVIVYDLDRLARKLSDQLLIVDEFEHHGAKLELITGPVEATPEGKMFLQMRGVFSEFEKSKIRERTMRGRREKAQQGFVNGGRPPYGYSYKGKAQGSRGELVVIPEQAEIVKRIFAMCEKGMSSGQIARALTDEGTRPLRAEQWDRRTVRKLLGARVYVGVGHYNRRQTAEPADSARRKPRPAGRSKKTTLRARPASEWIELKVPRIISDAQFARVQKKLNESGPKHTGRPSTRYALTGKVRCNLCGRAAIGYPNRRRPFYRCGNINQLTYKRICPSHAMKAETLENEVLAILLRFKSPVELATAVTSDQKRRKEKASEDERARRAIEDNINKLEAREQRAAKALLDSDIRDSHSVFRRDLADTQAKRRALVERLKSLAPAPAPLNDVTYQRISRMLTNDFARLDKRAIFDRFVERVYLGDGRITHVEFSVDLAPAPADDGMSGVHGNQQHRQNDVPDMRAASKRLTFTVIHKAA